MLLNLRVQGFKSLRDVSLDLGRLTVLFGPNAAGKSNLLEALVLLSRLIGERTLEDAFNGGIRGYPHEAFSLGKDGLEGLLKAERATLRLDARLGSDKHHLSYGLEVGLTPQTGALSLVDEHLQRLTSGGKPMGNASIVRVDKDGGPRILIRKKGAGSHPFEEPQGLNHTLVSNLQYSGDHRYPDFEALRAEVGTWRVVYLDPRQAMRLSQPPREVGDIGERGEHLVPFLHRLAANPRTLKDLKAVIRATRAVIPSIDDVRTELVGSRGEVDLQILQDGVWMSTRVVSEGTLRVLALCAMAANPFNTGLVAFEEPENGVHPRRIENVARILATASKRRQVVVSTHSPLIVGEIVQLVREGALAAPDVRLIACSSSPSGTRIRLFEPSGPLFADAEVTQTLIAHEDAAVTQALLERGWLDG